MSVSFIPLHLITAAFCDLTSSQRWCFWFFYQLKVRPSTGKRWQLNWLQYWLYWGGLKLNSQYLWGIPSYIGLFDIIRRYKIFKSYQLLHLRLLFSHWYKHIQVEMKKSDHLVVTETRTFYLQISPHSHPNHITDDQSGWPRLARFQVE